jgi:cytochrome oxidase Cu insertion factor (SCO1/SenC/PrrC family)
MHFFSHRSPWPGRHDVQPIFITVNPQRDTVEHLGDYVSAFHPRLIGLTRPAHDIRKLALAYRVYYAKAQPSTANPTQSTKPDSSICSTAMENTWDFFHAVRHLIAWSRSSGIFLMEG